MHRTYRQAPGRGIDLGPSACVAPSASPFASGVPMPSRSPMRASSASDRAPIFSMTRARWTLMVFSTVPRSPAICLFNFPATTWSSTSRSRGVSVASRSRTSAMSRCARRATLSVSTASPTAASRSSSFTGLERKFSAPARIARTLVGMSPWPVMNTIGSGQPASTSRRCNSSPSTPGIATSSTRQPGAAAIVLAQELFG